jgi:hypothetical protein
MGFGFIAERGDCGEGRGGSGGSETRRRRDRDINIERLTLNVEGKKI